MSTLSEQKAATRKALEAAGYEVVLAYDAKAEPYRACQGLNCLVDEAILVRVADPVAYMKAEDARYV